MRGSDPTTIARAFAAERLQRYVTVLHCVPGGITSIPEGGHHAWRVVVLAVHHGTEARRARRVARVSPLCGSKRELCTRCCWPHNGLGAPRARPPERSGDRGAPRATAKGVRGGEAPRI